MGKVTLGRFVIWGMAICIVLNIETSLAHSARYPRKVEIKQTKINSDSSFESKEDNLAVSSFTDQIITLSTRNLKMKTQILSILLFALIACNQKVIAEPQSDSQKTGSIEGGLLYPSEYIPAQKVCAQSIANPYLLNCIEIKEDQQTYRLYVKPGDYFVFSSERPISGEGLTIYHTVIDSSVSKPQPGTVVRVSPGQQVRGIDINNWFACEATKFNRYCIWNR